jgi:hypothetical protein
MNKEHQAQLLKICTEDFFTHPNWNSVLEVIEFYISDLYSIENIDTKGKTNDEIATELRARQITKERLKRFIDDSLTLKKVKETVPKTQRKFK